MKLQMKENKMIKRSLFCCLTLVERTVDLLIFCNCVGGCFPLFAHTLAHSLALTLQTGESANNIKQLSLFENKWGTRKKIDIKKSKNKKKSKTSDWCVRASAREQANRIETFAFHFWLSQPESMQQGNCLRLSLMHFRAVISRHGRTGHGGITTRWRIQKN